MYTHNKELVFRHASLFILQLVNVPGAAHR